MKRQILIIAAVQIFFSISNALAAYPFEDSNLPIEDRVNNIISLMTLDEKIHCLGTDPNVPRLGIKGTRHIEGLHGVAMGVPGNWGRTNPIPTTTFPQAIGLAQTWDPEIIQQAAAIEGYEARYLFQCEKYKRGGLVVRAPNADMGRDPRWGRTEECYGEDPYLNGTLVTAFVKGLQGDNPKYWLTASLMKHFFANSNENGRSYTSSNFDERLFREYYSVPFRMGIINGGSRAFMAAYNAYNGVPCTVNPILKNVTQKEWGNDGIICTDGGGFRLLVSAHKYYPDMNIAAGAVIKAGISQFLDRFIDPVHSAVEQNLLAEADIDKVIKGNFRVMIRLGLLDGPDDNPYANIGKIETQDPWLTEKPKALVRLVTQKSIVLLKNKNNLLPLNKDKLKSIAVIGPRANEVLFDWYSGSPPYTVSPLEGIRNKVGPDTKVNFAPDVNDDSTIKMIKSSDVAIVCVGNHPTCDANFGGCPNPEEGKEAVDRVFISLSQEEIIKKVFKANPKTIVVLICNFPYAINWTNENVPAIIDLTNNSQEQGNAIADVLFGDYNPAGRLVQTWPKSIDQLPPMMDYNIRNGRTYMYFGGEPLYPFGYGLSYTTFKYSNLRTDSDNLRENGEVTVSVDIQNTGKRKGEEVVQMYVSHINSSVERPTKELKGFKRISLEPKEKMTVQIPLKAESIAYWDKDKHAFVVEKDKIKILLGGSSSDIKLEKNLNVTGDKPALDTNKQEDLSLWYKQPAKQWVEALPVGNGRLGAMVFGGIDKERIQLNEDTLWAGGSYDPTNPNALAALPEARRLIFAGEYKEASKLIGAKMMAKPLRQMQYQPVGDLLLDFTDTNETKNYRRELNLDTAIAATTFDIDDTTFTREVFSSPVDQVIVVHLSANKPGQISFTASMKTPQKAVVKTESTEILLMKGVNGSSEGIKGALKFEARVKVLTQGGKIIEDNNSFVVKNADSATLLIAAATSYKSFKDVNGNPEALTKEYISKASKKSFDNLRKNNVAEHQRLFRRVKLDLGITDAAKLPTDERIKAFNNVNDPQLAMLYFQFGRYLLITSSRPGGQPANLQGLWNESMNPPWGSKYTVNINTEMNYWLAEPTNLSECVEPLIAMVLDLTETGAHTAKVQWDANGWVCHHNTDLWRASAPIDGPLWGFWPTGGAWLCKHLWDHYEYTCDKKFLEKTYPVMKGSAQFFLDTLVEEPHHHWLVTCPSLSPENNHLYGVSNCAGPTMDMQILRDLFTNCIKASEILGVDKDFREKLVTARERLAPNQIGKAGQLQEWLDDWDMQAPEIQHRHNSHLYGLYPSDQISLSKTPELAAAARKSLEIRGDGGTGWSKAWKINLWARLHDGNHAYKMLAEQLRLVGSTGTDYSGGGGTYANMFDAHPPFQIDGNFGGTSGIAEMLLQCCNGQIELLPALPNAWPNGTVKGLRAKGGYEIDIEWKDGNLKSAKIQSITGSSCKALYGQKTIDLNLKPGKSITLDENLKSL